MVRSLVWKSLALALLLAPTPVLAQEADAPPDAEAPATRPQPAAPASEPGDFWHEVAGQSGFQLALRLGGALPAGNLANGSTLASQYGGQFALNLDVGGKANKYVFIGAFFGAGFGGVGSGIIGCGTGGVSCSVKTLRVGPEVVVSILPDLRVNPWIGAGVGFEYSPVSVDNAGPFSGTYAPYGPEFAHIMVGADFRLNRWIGGGPFLDVSIAEFTTETDSSTDGTSVTHEIPQKSTHEWIQVGFRFVLFP